MRTYELYNAIIEEAIKAITEAEAEAERLANIKDFTTLAEIDTYNHDLRDANEKIEIFKALLKIAKDAKEFREYENALLPW